MPKTAAPLITWSRSFPAAPEQVREARRFLAAILADRDAADATLCLSELVTNAIVHSHSRQPGGTFTVRAQLDRDRLRVEVRDQGGPWHTPGRAHPDEPNGRGLLIVSQFAARWGCEGHSQTGWNVWFEIQARPSGQSGDKKPSVPCYFSISSPRYPPTPDQRQREDTPPMTETLSPTRTASRWFAVIDGRRVRQLRRQHGLTAAGLAGKAGIGLSTVTRLERQRQRRCRTRTLARLAAALGQPPAALIPQPAQPDRVTPP